MIIRSLLKQPVLTISFHARDARWTLGRAGRVSSSGRIPLPGGSIVDGAIPEPAIVGELLRRAQDFPGRGRMQVALALPAQRTVFRVMDLPRVTGKKFDELVEREIRREMPMLAENAHTAWQRMPDRDGKAIVFVVGVARDILDSHVAAARAAGLHPQSADLRVIAAARAIGVADCVVANVEETEAEIAIFRDGMPNIVRHIDMVADPLEWTRQLADELARTLKFYRDTHRDDDLAANLPISFVGDAAQRAVFAPEIAEQTGHPSELPHLRLIVSPEQDTPAFAANVGLVLKDIAA